MRFLRFLTGALLVAAVSVGVLAGPASAAPVPQVLKLEKFNATSGEPSEASTFRWYRGRADTPVDHNKALLRAHIAGGDAVDAYTNQSINIDRDVSKMPRLSFDFRLANSDLGFATVGERISVHLDDGTWAYLDSAYCNHDLGSGWSSANFTGFHNNCSFYDSTGTQYSADGTHTAWQNFVAAHSGQNVVETFFVIDANYAGTTYQNYVVDRLFLGTGQVFDNGKLGHVA